MVTAKSLTKKPLNSGFFVGQIYIFKWPLAF
jgi:hypothetical protein